MRIFVVGKGDGLRSVARRCCVSAERLAAVNALSPHEALCVGQALVVPGEASPAESIEVNAFAYPSVGERRLSAVLPSLTYLCPFSCRANADGDILPISDGEMISIALRFGVCPMATVSNIGQGGGFDADIAHAVVNASRDRFVDNATALLKSHGCMGLCLCFAYIRPYDRSGYTELLRTLSERLHKEGFLFFAAVAPKETDDAQDLGSFAYDYAAHGKYCDRVVIMSYDSGHAHSAPRAVSPTDELHRVLAYAVTRIDSKKLLMGFSNYGYDWTLPHESGDTAQLIPNGAAISLAATKAAEIRFDDTAKAPYFNYTDPLGIRHELWFEDARSVVSRLRLVREYSLAGISLASVSGFGQSERYLFNSMFNAEKML